MGLFNWVFKGVKVEKRRPSTSSKDAVMDLQQLSPDGAAPRGDDLVRNDSIMRGDIASRSDILLRSDTARGDFNMHTQEAGGGSAASILFENTERQQMGSGFQYSPNSFNGGQYPAGGVPSNFGASALGGASYGNRNILVVTPSSNVEVTEIVQNLRNGDACIVCLEGLEVTDAQRRLDFLSGVIHALNGNIKRLNANTYVLTPTGIGVKKQNQ